MRIVELQDMGQFILVNPKEVGDGVKKIKYCKAYSLEYEFTFKKLSLASSTYNFWNPVTPDSTLMSIILEMMPSWHIGHIDDELVGKYRTFEVSDENLYNFIKGTIQDSYNCIFDFDTMTREINVKSASSLVPTNPVYISNSNLAKEITVEENTESIVTRLDVNGADGVDIRDVNPMGTNQIINLDYFMNTDNFSQTVIDKYWSWKETYKNYQQQYYNLSVEYALQIMRKATEQAALVELEHELTGLENEQAVIIQAMALDPSHQGRLIDVNNRIASKQSEIKMKKSEINSVDLVAQSIYKQLVAINNKTNFKAAFEPEEYLQIDRYIKDDAVSESSFVVQTTDSYTDEDIGNSVSNMPISISGANISKVTNSQNKDIYDIKCGEIASGSINAQIISAAFEKSADNSFVLTAYLGAGTIGESAFPKGCISLTGKIYSFASDLKIDPGYPDMLAGSTLSIGVASGYMYFTRSTSEYEKRAVAWELFEYGNEILTKISQPSYTFGITSSNFLGIDEFKKFKNKLCIGEKIYVGISEDATLQPICIGLKFEFDSPDGMTLEFSDTYVSSDSSFLLADLLEQSVSMGKSVDLSKFSYSAFMDSGASTKVKEFMTTALDVAKNAILSSENQAISWGDSGIRLRKWKDEAHTEYEDKQIWMNNNSILMTSNNWATAELAIGNFRDPNLGECWGVVAPNIVGTLLAGSNLVIESVKKDNSVAVFKVDAEGCFLHNSNLSVTSGSTNTHILVDPAHGLMIGKYPLVKTDGTIDDTKKLFYADTEGNLTLKGTIYASAGEFTGRVTAEEGKIGGWTIESHKIYAGGSNGIDGIGTAAVQAPSASVTWVFAAGGSNHDSYVDCPFRVNKYGKLVASNAEITGKVKATSGEIGTGLYRWMISENTTYGSLYSGKPSYSSNTHGVYIGTDGISLGNEASYIKADVDGTLKANNVDISGKITATSGTIGGCQIINEKLTVTNANIENLEVKKITGGSSNADITFKGNITAENATIKGKITATSGKIGGCQIDNGVLKIKSANIDELSADKISGGTLNFNQINVSNLSADLISGGHISANLINSGTLKGCSISIGNYFSVSDKGIAQLSNNTGYISMGNTSYHPYLSAINLAWTENAISFRSGTSINNIGSQKAAIGVTGDGHFKIKPGGEFYINDKYGQTFQIRVQAATGHHAYLCFYKGLCVGYKSQPDSSGTYPDISSNYNN